MPIQTRFAASLTVLAAERIYAEWVRTGIVALALGIGANKLLSNITPHWLTIFSAIGLILFSVFCFAASVWDQITPGATSRRLDADRIPSSLLLAVSALLGLVSLLALFGVIFGITVASPS